MDIGLLIVSLAVPAIIGWKILSLFLDDQTKFSVLEKLFFAYGLGFACITLIMFYLSLLGLSFQLHWLILILTVFLFLLQKYGPRESIKWKALSVAPIINLIHYPVPILLMLFIIFNLYTLFFRTIVVDIDMWDSWAFWAFKAKLFYYHQRIPLEEFGKFKEVWGNWDYPHHVPLMETWIMLWLGYWNDILPRIIFPLFYTGICVVAFYFLRRRLSLTAALAGACFFANLNKLQIYAIGTIAEPILLFYYLASFVLLYEWAASRNVRLLILSSIFSGIMLWTKQEGSVLMAGNVLFMLFIMLKDKSFKWQSINVLWYFLIPILIIAPWNIFKVATHLQSWTFNEGYFQLAYIPKYIARLKMIHVAFGYHFLNFAIWNILWLMFATACLYNLIFRKNRNANFLLFIIFFQFSVYAFLYVTIPWETDMFVFDALSRLLIAPAILSILYSCLVLFI